MPRGIPKKKATKPAKTASPTMYLIGVQFNNADKIYTYSIAKPVKLGDRLVANEAIVTVVQLIQASLRYSTNNTTEITERVVAL